MKNDTSSPSNFSIEVIMFRHAPRSSDPTYFSPLTIQGHQCAQNLSASLAQFSPMDLYSSPFLRCLQTIAPLAQKTNTKIRMDLALSELLADRRFSGFKMPDPTSVDIIRTIEELDSSMSHPTPIVPHLDLNYRSCINPESICFPESFSSLSRRVETFLHHLVRLYSHSPNQRVAVCTHMHAINAAIRIGEPSWHPNTYVDNASPCIFKLSQDQNRLIMNILTFPKTTR